MILGAVGSDTANAFIELGAVALGLAVLARLAGRLGITAIPFYLLAGLAVGEGGFVRLDVSSEFVELVAEIGVLLLLLALGLEYSAEELRSGLRSGLRPGALDALLNFTPGFLLGLALGWDVAPAVLLGGACWVSSSGIIAKVLADLDRLGNRETPAVLNLLVIEDLAMAVYLPIAGALVAGDDLAATATTVAVALVAVGVILTVALRFGGHLSALPRGRQRRVAVARRVRAHAARRRARPAARGVGRDRRVPGGPRALGAGAAPRRGAHRAAARPVRRALLPRSSRSRSTQATWSARSPRPRSSPRSASPARRRRAGTPPGAPASPARAGCGPG